MNFSVWPQPSRVEAQGTKIWVQEFAGAQEKLHLGLQFGLGCGAAVWEQGVGLFVWE